MSPRLQQNEPIDIFISYCHDDNTPPFGSDNEPGWVTALHKNLGIRLKQISGKESNIWRDPVLDGTGQLSETLREKIENTYFLMVIVSPLYLHSKWCDTERDAFIEKYGENGIDRILRIDKLPVNPPPSLPGELEDKYAYRFYEIDPETKNPLEFSFQDLETKRKFQTSINDLACDIKNEMSTDHLVDKSKENTIYLAETTQDLLEYRNEIERELNQRHFHILPKQSLGRTAEKAGAAIKENLNKSFLSIHLVGNEYEPLKTDENVSITDLQFKQASDFCKDDSLQTLIWMPDDINPSNDKQKELIDIIEKDKNITDVIIDTVEKFKTEIKDHITIAKEKATEKELEPKTKDGTIYIYSSKTDLKDDHRKEQKNHISQLKQHLFDEGYNVLLAEYFDTDEDTAEIHQENIEDCDSLLIYLGVSDRKWNRDVLRDLRKNPDFGKEKPLKTVCIYIESGLEMPAVHGVTMLQGENIFSTDKVKPFIENLDA